MLEVKVATPKEEMMRAPIKKVTRIFVARIPDSVNEAAFRSYFETYGEITDLYMPKDHGSKGIVELGLSHLQVQEEEFRPVSRVPQGGYGAYNAYITAATRYAALGAPTLYDHPGSVYGRGESTRAMGKKIFVGRLPQEASAEDLRQYFGRFGRILDVYVPKDPKRSGHRGFGFVTFAEDGVADRVSRRSHEICGQQVWKWKLNGDWKLVFVRDFNDWEMDMVGELLHTLRGQRPLWRMTQLCGGREEMVAIDSATPLDDAGSSGNFMMDSAEPFGGFGGPMRTYGRMYGSLDFDDWGYGIGGGRPSRADWRTNIEYGFFIEWTHVSALTPDIPGHIVSH
ncbi:hypothetical protein CK203_001783 [Vitis vinifera]|uniref:RRM domain-containing protein n=1 Tax=Vitis vinifera TaxID=29760 RepID=A0A438KJI4_VITVI|nr:hypothetical protein CK203_001783 [Vitis vinifera]